KAAKKLFAPYASAATEEACVKGSVVVSPPTTTDVTVTPQTIKVHGAPDARSYLVDTTITVPNQQPSKIESAQIIIRYKNGVTFATVGGPSSQVAAAPSAVTQAVKDSIAHLN